MSGEKTQPYDTSWVYPVAAVVIRHLRMKDADGKDMFKPVVHRFIPLTGLAEKYNIQDVSRRMNPAHVKIDVEREITEEINDFKNKLVEFRNADFNIYFIEVGDVNYWAGLTPSGVTG